MAETTDLLVWMDMEMTGLDPASCVPLQAAVIITTGDLVEMDSMEVTIWQPESKLAEMVPIVQRMHSENGLLAQVRSSPVSLGEAEVKLMQMIARWCKPREGVLAGNSIHQDRKFIDTYFPTIAGYLHYRMVDVSTVKELVKRWYGPDCAFPKTASMHTALSDARASIAELKHYRKMVMKPGKSEAAG